MKKLFLALFVMFSVTAVALAAGPTYGTIIVSCNCSPSVAVSTAGSVASSDYLDAVSTFTLGALNTGFTCQLSPFYIWNTSPQTASCVQIYKLDSGGAVTVSSGTVWTYKTSGVWPTTNAGVDTCALGGTFQSAQPAAGAYDNTCYITSSQQVWSGSNYNVGANPYGSQRHGNTTAGTPTYILLWIELVTPSSVSTNKAQYITINVTANMAG